MFGRIQEQKEIIKSQSNHNMIRLKLLDISTSYFGQKILNNKEQKNLNLLLKNL